MKARHPQVGDLQNVRDLRMHYASDDTVESVLFRTISQFLVLNREIISSLKRCNNLF
jgi:hypothetical protein